MKKLFLLILFIISCSNQKPLPTPIVKDTNMCPAAEENLKVVCPLFVKPNKTMKENNETFKDFCERKHDSGIWLNPVCLSTATSCEEADKCTNSHVE